MLASETKNNDPAFSVIYRTTPFGDEYRCFATGLTKNEARDAQADLKRNILVGSKTLCPSWILTTEMAKRRHPEAFTS